MVFLQISLLLVSIWSFFMALFQLCQLKLLELFRHDIFPSSHPRNLRWVLRELLNLFWAYLLLYQIISCLGLCFCFLIFFLPFTSFLLAFLKHISCLNFKSYFHRVLLVRYQICHVSFYCSYPFACWIFHLLHLPSQLSLLRFCIYADDACFGASALMAQLASMLLITLILIFLIYCLLHCHHLTLRPFLL